MIRHFLEKDFVPLSYSLNVILTFDRLIAVNNGKKRKMMINARGCEARGGKLISVTFYFEKKIRLLKKISAFR